MTAPSSAPSSPPASQRLLLSGVSDAQARVLADALARNTHLKTLKLGGNAFGEEAAKAVGEAIIGNKALLFQLRVLRRHRGHDPVQLEERVAPLHLR